MLRLLTVVPQLRKVVAAFLHAIPGLTGVMAIMAIMFLPAVIGRRFRVHIPPECHVLAVLFAFAARFLGEIHSYYMRFWWWDIALHTSSGLLMGILGFLLIYVLNADERIDIHMRPRFMALFALPLPDCPPCLGTAIRAICRPCAGTAGNAEARMKAG